MKSIIEKTEGVQVDQFYSVKFSEIQELCEIAERDTGKAIILAFRYGYLKGTKVLVKRLASHQEKLRQLLSVLARNDADFAKNVLTYAVCRERALHKAQEKGGEENG